MIQRKSILIASAVAALGLAAIGCEEKKTTPPPAPKPSAPKTPTPPPAPTGTTPTTPAPTGG